MKNLKDIITIARQIVAEEGWDVEVTDEGLVRTTVENPRETETRRLHVGTHTLQTGAVRAAFVVTRHDGDIDEDATELFEDDFGLSLPHQIESEDTRERMTRRIYAQIVGALEDVQINTVS